MRVTTFNILHGRSPADGQVDLDRFCDTIRRLDPDVLALQEVDRGQPRSQCADLTELAAEAMQASEFRFAPALTGQPGTWQQATGSEPAGSPQYGIALLSRLPVLAWQQLRLPAVPGRVPMLFPGRRRPVLVADEPRVALGARMTTPQGDVTVVGTHLSFLPGWNMVQLQRLSAALGADDPLVLVGDLNMGASRAARVSGLRPLVRAVTFPSHAPRQQLDHVLVRGAVRLAGSARIESLDVSDHCAVTAELAIG